MARVDPTYLPEAASTSRNVAIHFLTSSEGNLQCGYHAFQHKSTCMRDGWGKEGMRVRGVPGKKKVWDPKKKSDEGVEEKKSGGKKKTPDEKKKGLLLRPAKDLGNCGCRIDDILLEFVLSKCLKIRGMVDGSCAEEMMMGTQDYQEPRDRSFMFEALRLLTPSFSLNDFFKHSNNEARQEVKIARKQARYCLDVLNTKYKIHSPDEFVFKELQVISKARLQELLAKEKRLEELEESSSVTRMET
jgi:hypothetical protein